MPRTGGAGHCPLVGGLSRREPVAGLPTAAGQTEELVGDDAQIDDRPSIADQGDALVTVERADPFTFAEPQAILCFESIEQRCDHVFRLGADAVNNIGGQETRAEHLQKRFDECLRRRFLHESEVVRIEVYMHPLHPIHLIHIRLCLQISQDIQVEAPATTMAQATFYTVTAS